MERLGHELAGQVPGLRPGQDGDLQQPDGGTQRFYLAQIDKVHAGKTMEIKLFDPGDVAGNAFMRVLSPDGNTYSYVNFSYSADNGRNSTARSRRSRRPRLRVTATTRAP